jgi:hypothetical protein
VRITLLTALCCAGDGASSRATGSVRDSPARSIAAAQAASTHQVRLDDGCWMVGDGIINQYLTQVPHYPLVLRAQDVSWTLCCLVPCCKVPRLAPAHPGAGDSWLLSCCVGLFVLPSLSNPTHLTDFAGHRATLSIAPKVPVLGRSGSCCGWQQLLSRRQSDKPTQ